MIILTLIYVIEVNEFLLIHRIHDIFLSLKYMILLLTHLLQK